MPKAYLEFSIIAASDLDHVTGGFENINSHVVGELRDRGMDNRDLAKLNKQVGDNLAINDQASSVPAEIVRRTAPLI